MVSNPSLVSQSCLPALTVTSSTDTPSRHPVQVFVDTGVEPPSAAVGPHPIELAVAATAVGTAGKVVPPATMTPASDVPPL